MKYIIRISLVLLSLFLLLSCSSDHQLLPDETQQIQFQSGVSPTRGAAVTAIPDGGAFGVLGYCKINGQDGTSDWDIKKVLATPDVFYNKPVRYEAALGLCTYDDLVPWSNEKQDKYTFFAYYPYNAVNAEGVGNPFSLSKQTHQGAPIITYTQPFAGASTTANLDETLCQDVLWSRVENHQSPMGHVPFSFKHLLTSIDVAFNNYNSTADIDVRQVFLRGSYPKTMALNADDATYTTTGNFKGQFTLRQKKFTIAPNAHTGMTLVPLDNQVFFIAEAEGTSNDLDLVLQIKNANEKDNFVTKTFSLRGYDFNPGIRNTVCLNVIGDLCTVSVVQADRWETGIEPDKDDVLFE